MITAYTPYRDLLRSVATNIEIIGNYLCDCVSSFKIISYLYILFFREVYRQFVDIVPV